MSSDMNAYDMVRTELAKNQAVFRALGDVARQEIVLLLARADTKLSVGELAAQTKLSRPAVSHHLRVLKDAGLLGEVKIGVRRYYKPTFTQAIGNLKQLSKTIRKAKEIK